MKFELFHNRYFNSQTGAFSRVTEREFFDSQITLTGVEQEIVESYFGINNIHRGNVNQNKVLSAKPFKVFNTGKLTNLNVIYPKYDKDELRIYLSLKAGFKPPSNSIWFIFHGKDDFLHVGFLDPQAWFNLGQNDVQDLDYLESILETGDGGIDDVDQMPDVGIIMKKETKNGLSFYRNPKIARKRLILSHYKCEYNPSHDTFTSASWKKQFVEAHHIIPMAFQEDFAVPLDQVNNIASLCPNCHRAFHLAIPEQKRFYITEIYQKRTELETLCNLETLLGLYNCYEI